MAPITNTVHSVRRSGFYIGDKPDHPH